MFQLAEFIWRIDVRKLLTVVFLICTSVFSLSAENPRFIINSGHTDLVSSLDAPAEGNLLVSGSYDGTVKVWNTANGKISYQLQVSHLPVRKTAVCPGKPIAAVVVSDGINAVDLTVWNWETGEMLFRHRLTEVPLFLKFSPQGSFIVYGKADWDSLSFLDAETGKNLNLIPDGFGIVSSVFISESEKTLLSYNNSGSIQYWDLTNGNRKAKMSTISDLEQLSFTSNGRYMTGFSGRELVLIDLTKGTKIDSVSAANLSNSYIDQSGDRLIWIEKEARYITLHSTTISSRGLGVPEEIRVLNLQQPTSLISSGGRVFTAFADGSIYSRVAYSNTLTPFAENNLLEINDFAINETALAITSPGKLLSISSGFFTDRIEGIINPEAASKVSNLDSTNRYGVSAGRGSDFLIWESESKTGGSIRRFDSETGIMSPLAGISAPASLGGIRHRQASHPRS